MTEAQKAHDLFLSEKHRREHEEDMKFARPYLRCNEMLQMLIKLKCITKEDAKPMIRKNDIKLYELMDKRVR